MIPVNLSHVKRSLACMMGARNLLLEQEETDDEQKPLSIRGLCQNVSQTELLLLVKINLSLDLMEFDLVKVRRLSRSTMKFFEDM